MISEKDRLAFRALARDLDGIDVDVYEGCGRSPLEPVIGQGNRNARIGFFGRDPGRDEVQHQMPFIGAGGQKVRAACHEHLHGEPLPDFEASLAVGRHFFWANTVPYKPVGNKAWSMKVKKAFQPLVNRLLLNAWDGQEMITLGREAFLWFAINQPRETRQRLEAFWADETRFASSIEVNLHDDDTGLERRLRLHPLPHPSPLNATWYARFPELLKARLARLDARADRLVLQPAASAD